MLGFGKKKEEEKKKQQALMEARALMDKLITTLEQRQASGEKPTAIELTSAYGLAGQVPDGGRYQRRLKKLAAAQGIRLVGGDEM